MAAPTFVGATVGAATTGTTLLNPNVPGGAAGDLVIVQVLADATPATDPTLLTADGTYENLAGTVNALTPITPAGGSALAGTAKQFLYAARKRNAFTNTAINMSVDGAVDHFSRVYLFTNVNTGTALTDILENGTAGTIVNATGATAAVADTGVTTLGADRLALQFVAVDDDNPLDAFTGMTGGTWVEAVAEFATATGTDGAIQLQTATIASAGTINGGSYTMAAIDNWGVIGFALKPVPSGTAHTATPADTLSLADSVATQRGIGQPVADTLALTDLATPDHVVPPLDDFNRADGALGANWTADIKNNGAVMPAITSNEVLVGLNSSAWWNAAQFGPDTEVRATIATWAPTSNANGIHLFARVTSPGTSAWSGYEGWFIVDTTSGTLDIAVVGRVSAGSETYPLVVNPTKFLDGDELKLEVIGDEITLSRKRSGTWTELGSYTDPSPLTGSGYAGFFASTAFGIDNFAASPPVSATAHTQPVADTLAVADALASQAAFTRTVTDPLSLADSQAFQRNIAQAVADTLALSDLATTAAGKGVTLADTLALADGVTSQAAFLRGLADTLSLADTIAAQSAYQLSIADTLALADSLASQAAFVRALADTLTLADLADPVKGVGGVAHTQPIADTLALADALTAGSTLARAIADTLAVADSVTAQKAILRALADTVSVADAIRFGRAVGLTDTVTLADAVSFQAAYLRTLADTVSLADAVTAGLQLTRAIADTVALLDSLAATLGRAVTVADVLSLTDDLDALLTAAVGEPPRASGLIDFPGIGTITRPTRGARVGNNRGNINTSHQGVLTKPTRGAT